MSHPRSPTPLTTTSLYPKSNIHDIQCLSHLLPHPRHLKHPLPQLRPLNQHQQDGGPKRGIFYLFLNYSFGVCPLAPSILLLQLYFKWKLSVDFHWIKTPKAVYQKYTFRLSKNVCLFGYTELQSWA